MPFYFMLENVFNVHNIKKYYMRDTYTVMRIQCKFGDFYNFLIVYL